MTNEPTNADRAQWAKDALAVFAARTFKGDHPNTMNRDDLKCAVSDLIADLLHYTRQQGFDAGNIIQQACGHFGFELLNEALAPHSSLPVRFDDYEIQPCRRYFEADEPDQSFVEPCAPFEADFWTVYGHIPGEGVQAIGDFDTRQHAEEVFARITGRVYGRAPRKEVRHA